MGFRRGGDDQPLDIITAQNLIQRQAGIHIRILAFELRQHLFTLVTNQFEGADLVGNCERGFYPSSRFR